MSRSQGKTIVTNIPATVFLTLLIDCLLLVVSLTHIPSLQERATLPFTVGERNGSLVIEKVSPETDAASVSPGDTVLAVNDSAIVIPELLEFIADHFAIGEACRVTVLRNGVPFSTTVIAKGYYPSILYIIIVYFVGFSFLFVGAFVLWSRPRDKIAHLFHWMMALVGTVIMITWGRIEPGSLQTTAVRSLFFVAYVFGIASFYLFTILYCAAAPRFIAARISAVYAAAAAICAPMTYHHVRAVREGSLTAYVQFQWQFDLFHTVILIAFIAGITNIVRAYRNTSASEDRNRLEWIIWGFSISCAPFLLLYIIPQLFFNRYLVPEEYTTIFFIALPFSFGVSFIKHHLFDIRLLIKRTIVNTLFSVLIAVSYFIIVLLSAALIDDTLLTSGQFAVVAVTLIIAMMLNPVRIGLKRFIDRLLFKAQAEYGRIIADVADQLQHAVSEEQIFVILAETIHTNLPVEQCTLYRRKDGLLHLIGSDGTPAAGSPVIAESWFGLAGRRVLAVDSIVRTTDPADIQIDNSLPERTGFELVLPILNGTSAVCGAVGIRRLRSRERFEREELSLLSALCRRTGEHLDRLALMESIFREKEERKQAEALNRQKSDFVSYVSHELQTPLTSISLFAELLQKNVRGRKAKEQVSIVSGETERLSRMVNNLLDVTRIESGLKEYRMEPCSMNDIVLSVVGKMSYMIENHGFTLRTSVPRTPIMFRADKDALEQAIMNLISNAIKYSRKKKQITISLSRKNTEAVCTVEDRGDGIPAAQIPFLFDRFYRLPQHHRTVSGIGIGLSLVHHIIEAHHGSIRVRSTVGKGSAFTITLPLSAKPTI
jgi:signal transduction histidine kinase